MLGRLLPACLRHVILLLDGRQGLQSFFYVLEGLVDFVVVHDQVEVDV
jgi:hypothetical protein